MTVCLDEKVCDEARDKLVELLEAQDAKGILIQLRAAESLLRACQTQERYTLRPQTPDDYERAATRRGSEAKRLEDMTPEELLELQREMLGDDFPGKPV
jgi:hypothetical protein